MKRKFFSGLFAISVFAFASVSFAAGSQEQSELTYDVGVSSGSTNDRSYTEANLGLNYHFMDYLTWRNALFGRFVSGQDSIYGIDTSLRGQVSFGDRQLGLSAFLGPGWRFATKGDNAPFAEGGVILSAAGISVGAGAKDIFNSAVHPGATDDRQIFLILAGGGAF